MFMTITLPTVGPCPSGFIDDGSGFLCYRFLDSNFMASDAQKSCESQAANIPIFRSSYETNYYISLAYKQIELLFQIY